MRVTQRSPEVLQAFEAIDQANSLDPNRVLFNGVEQPLALLQGRLASCWQERLDPEAGSAVRIAVRAHHLRRWTVDRGSYPEGRVGYQRWKKAAKVVHGAALAEITADCGLENAMVARAQQLVQRIGLGTDAETQVVEDCACLVFLETQYEALIEKIGRDKVIEAVRKTVKKMSPAAIALAGEAISGELGRSVLAEAVDEDSV